MSQQYIDDNDVLARYLADQLSADDRKAFEATCLQDPMVVQNLERVARFKVGLMAAKNANLVEPAPQYRPRSRVVRYAMAASVLAIGIVSLFVVVGNYSRPIMASAHSELKAGFRSIPVGETYTIRRTRSSSYDASITVSKEAQAIVLRIRPEFTAPGEKYTVTLSTHTDAGPGPRLSSVDNLEINADGLIVVYLNSAKLVSGVYDVSVAGISSAATAEVSTFLVEVTRN